MYSSLFRPERERALQTKALLSGTAQKILWTAEVGLEEQNVRASFDRVAHERLDALETRFVVTLNSLTSLRAFYGASPFVDRGEFARFTSTLLKQNKAIQALEWIPRVPSTTTLS